MLFSSISFRMSFTLLAIKIPLSCIFYFVFCAGLDPRLDLPNFIVSYFGKKINRLPKNIVRRRLTKGMDCDRMTIVVYRYGEMCKRSRTVCDFAKSEGFAMQEMNQMQDCFVANIPGKDMTAAIEEKLNTYGACRLGSGTYLVSGVRMPPNATLSGLGRCTQLLLDPALEAGSTVSMDAFCCVKDLFLCGAEQKIELPEEPGARHGILYRGTATTKDWMGEGLKLNSIIVLQVM